MPTVTTLRLRRDADAAHDRLRRRGDHARRHVEARARELGGEDGLRELLVEEAHEPPDLRLLRLARAEAREQRPRQRIVQQVHVRPVLVLDLGRAVAALA